MKTFVPFSKIRLIICFAALFIAATVKAQTYTSVAAGNWSSASSWSGGIVPPYTIPAGATVNITKGIVCDLNSDINISGTLNITGDTLKFSSSFSKSIKVKQGGVLKITKGGLLNNTQTVTNDLSVDMGKIIFDSATVVISKDFLSIKGSSRSIKNSSVYIGRNYDLNGTITNPSVDSIQFSIVESNTLQNGEFHVHGYESLDVANAYVKVNNTSNFKVDAGATVATLPGANSNIGFDFLKVTGTLQNDGTWNARIDATCTGTINGSQMSDIDFTRSQDCSTTPLIGPAPELIFKNPVLVSGVANTQGAIYRFSNVITGVDAEIKLKKFSRPDIVMATIDNTAFGWDKAFQPEFGLPGTVQPYQNWYIDFELKFYQAGTNTIKTMPKVDMTALDVDGDNWSINEYASFQNPSNVSFSTISSLMNQPAANLGQISTCSIDGLVNILIACPTCGGDGKTGMWNLTDCPVCNGTGLLHAGCNHPFEDVNANVIEGPVTNCTNIDTAATQVMSVYQFTDRSVIYFRYGGRSGANTSTAGTRLNSLWFRQFSLAPVLTVVTLPVKLIDFTAAYTKPNATLRWSTAQEQNFNYFILESSTDGSVYKQTALIFAAGQNGLGADYNYVDHNLAARSGIIYYRLKIVDNDGKFTYSPIRIIRLGDQVQTPGITTYPNPVSSELRITLPPLWQNKTVSIDIYNSNGIKIKGLKTGNSSQTETITVSDLGTGIYFVKAVCGEEISQQKIIKN